MALGTISMQNGPKRNPWVCLFVLFCFVLYASSTV
jgi:hypothetical protein